MPISNSNSEIAVLPEYTKEHRKAIGNQLAAALMVQRTYGKQGDDLQSMVNIFCEALNDFEPAKVIKALGQWLKKSPEFPTPADIRQLIKPEVQYDYAVYSKLVEKSKRDGMSMLDSDWKYIRMYEANKMKGM